MAVFGFSPINGARRWIKFKGFSIQPSEIAKLSLALFLARFLEKRAGDESSFWRTFLPCFLVLGVVAGLVAKEPDLGTALMLAIICFTICFAAGIASAAPGLCGRAGLAVRRQDAHLHAVSHEAAIGFYRSLGRRAGNWLSGGAVVDCWLVQEARTDLGLPRAGRNSCFCPSHILILFSRWLAKSWAWLGL